MTRELLRDAVRHARWAREDIAKGEHLQAMINVIAANRAHAMSGAHGSGSYMRIEALLRSTTKALWRALDAAPATQRRAA